MDSSVKYQFLMSQLKPLQEIRDTEKTKLSIVFYEQTQSACLLRVCKNRDLSAVCESLRKVRNPNAAVVYDYVFYEGDTYILEENLNGKTVQEHIDMGQMFSEKETARIVVGICGALEDLHRETPPVVHNDINPSNIMLREDGSVKLFDFDISRLYKQGAGQNTTLFGTEEYASPEHYGYGQSEPRTDIYCLGVTMHKMLTGESLSTDHRITYRGKMKPILEKCLQFDPKDRYATAQALRKDLEQFLHGKKKGFLWIFVSIGILLLLLLGGYILKQGTKPTPVNPALQGTQTVQTTGEQDTEPDETTTPQGTENTEQPDQTEQPEQTEPTEQTNPPVNENEPPVQEQPSGGNTTPSAPNDEPTEPETPTASHTKETALKIKIYDEFMNENNWDTWAIEEEGEEHWWKFSYGSKEWGYVIVVDCSVADPVNGQTVACLYDSEGNELKTLTVGYGEKERFMNVVLEPGQEYYIKITGVNAEAPALGNYCLGLGEYRRYETGETTNEKLTLDTPYLSSEHSGYIEELYDFWVPKNGKYKVEICNHEDKEIYYQFGSQGIHMNPDPEELIEAGETVSFTFTDFQGEWASLRMFSRDPEADMFVPIGEYTILITYEGEVLEWSEYR